MKIFLENADNARDFRGIKNTHGKVIDTKLFIRSNNLHSLNEKDECILTKEYNLKKIIDLRTKTECIQKPDRQMKGVEYINIPVFNESAIGITHETGTDMQAVGLADIPDMAGLYVKMVTDDFCKGQLSKIMNVIVKNEEGAVLWHCTEGKDRCGIVSALFLFMLGVDKDIVLEDYLATNISATERAKGFYKKMIEITGNEEKALEVRNAFMANEDYFNAAYNEIVNRYGNVMNYIEKGLGIGRDKIEILKQRCLG